MVFPNMSKQSSKYQNDFEYFFHERMDYKILADPHQYEYVKAILKPAEEMQAVFCDAPAGSGKTAIALTAAYYMLQKGWISKIVYVRNTVSLRENGFLPGTPEEKEEIFMRPLFESINRIGLKDRRQDLYEDMVAKGELVATSTSYLRGTDISGDAIIIVDEAQNLSLGELRTVLTRKHDSVKAVIIGSHLQVDTPDIEKFGSVGILPFELFMNHFEKNEQIPTKRIELYRNYRGQFAQYADMVHETVSQFKKEEELHKKQEVYEELFKEQVLEERIIEVSEIEDFNERTLYETKFNNEKPTEVHPATSYLEAFD